MPPPRSAFVVHICHTFEIECKGTIFSSNNKIFVGDLCIFLKIEYRILKIVHFIMVSNEEKLLKERMRHLLHVKKCPISRLVDTETMRARIGRQINGDASIPFSTINLILYTFPDVSADWLVRGEGPISRNADVPRIINHNEANGSTAGGSIYVGTSSIPYPVQALLDEKDKRIEELEADKKQLQGLLSVLTSHAQSIGPKHKK